MFWPFWQPGQYLRTICTILLKYLCFELLFSYFHWQKKSEPEFLNVQTFSEWKSLNVSNANLLSNFSFNVLWVFYAFLFSSWSRTPNHQNIQIWFAYVHTFLNWEGFWNFGLISNFASRKQIEPLVKVLSYDFEPSKNLNYCQVDEFNFYASLKILDVWNLNICLLKWKKFALHFYDDLAIFKCDD